MKARFLVLVIVLVLVLSASADADPWMPGDAPLTPDTWGTVSMFTFPQTGFIDSNRCH